MFANGFGRIGEFMSDSVEREAKELLEKLLGIHQRDFGDKLDFSDRRFRRLHKEGPNRNLK